jgi:hypothetical protein
MDKASRSEILRSAKNFPNRVFSNLIRFLRLKIECFIQSKSFEGQVTDEDLTAMLLAQSAQQVPWHRQQLQLMQQQK